MRVVNTRICPVYGTGFSERLKFCPVCLLGMGLKAGIEPEETGAEVISKAFASEVALSRFEHYQVPVNQDGNPIELGRGAMGIAYKAFDVHLHCPVTLKVIAERYLADETARVRFLREARAAASIRHPNVEGKKFAEHWGGPDLFDLLQQLGALRFA